MISYFGNPGLFLSGYQFWSKSDKNIIPGNMVLNSDFREFIRLLNENDVKYLIVGGYAVALHGYPRYTKDIDIWLLVSHENAARIMMALRQFGFGSVGLAEEDFLKPDEFVQLGYPPNRIDLVMACDGLEFADVFSSRIEVEIDGIYMNFIDLENLKKNKMAAGRPQDLADLDNLDAKIQL